MRLFNEKLFKEVEICIEKLLHSQILLREISEGSGVSESILKKTKFWRTKDFEY